MNDSQPLDDLLDKSDKGQPLYADSAYTGEKQKKVIRKYRLKNKVHEKGYRGKPLTDNQRVAGSSPAGGARKSATYTEY